MLKIKSILFVAGSGFIFSFLTGMLSGNPFSVIFLRSLIGAAFFTMIVAGAVFVLKKALPEMSELISDNDDIEISEEKAGGNLDVVIEDDNPYIPAESDINESENMDEDKLLQKDFIEEVEEESIDDISILKEADDSDEVIEVMDDSLNSSSLPELDENVSFISGSSENSTGGDNDALNKLGSNVDPGTMAKAIKTILKKDQEG